ncbi:unnamed protein product [Rhizopus stolonifer]
MNPLDNANDFLSNDLQKMDEQLRCPICKELYKVASMITSCSHSFCSLCVHQCLSEETVCPQCRKQAFTNNIVYNAELDNFVRLWQSARETLQNADKWLSTNKTRNLVLPVQDIQLEDNDLNINFQPSPQRRSTRLENKPVIDTTTQLDPESGPLIGDSMVECPICSQMMKYAKLNKHLDGCTNGDSRIPASPPPIPISSSSKSVVNTGKKPRKVVYAMQSDKEMKNILKNLGLPEDGDKAQKIWRHKEYINLFNANVDSHRPVGVDTLIRRLADMEKTHEMNKNNQAKRKDVDSDIHKERYRDQFSELIEATKRRKKSSQ